MFLLKEKNLVLEVKKTGLFPNLWINQDSSSASTETH